MVKSQYFLDFPLSTPWTSNWRKEPGWDICSPTVKILLSSLVCQSSIITRTNAVASRDHFESPPWWGFQGLSDIWNVTVLKSASIHNSITTRQCWNSNKGTREGISWRKYMWLLKANCCCHLQSLLLSVLTCSKNMLRYSSLCNKAVLKL